MPIIELNSKDELYFIINKYNKIVLLFYVGWRVDCTRFIYSFIQESRKLSNIGIIFCRINCDLFPDVQILYDVNILKTPVTLFIENQLVKRRLEGDKPVSLNNYCIEFIG